MTLKERSAAVVKEVCRLAGLYPNTAAVNVVLLFAQNVQAEERDRCAAIIEDGEYATEGRETRDVLMEAATRIRAYVLDK